MEKPTGGWLSATRARRVGRWTLPSEYLRLRPPPTMMRVSGSAPRVMPKRSRTMVRYRRRRRRQGPGRRLNYRRTGAIPTKVRRVVRSVQYISLNPGAGALDYKAILLNSAHNPWSGLSADQPLTHDQYSALYTRYAVIGCSLQIEVVSMDGTTPVCAGITFAETNSAFSSYEHAKEVQPSTSRLLTPNLDKVVMSLSTGFSKWFGTRKILTEENYSANIGSDPTRVIYAHVWGQPVDQTADPGIIQIVATLKQIVVYYRRKNYVARS